MTREEIQTKVIELYVGILGRAPDYAGLTYWVDSIEQGSLTLEDTRASFATPAQDEYWTIYGGLDHSAMVEKIYNNFLARSPDADGFNYWVAELDSGNISPDFMINAIINAVQDPQATSEQTLNDAHVLSNKVTASRYFVEQTESFDTSNSAFNSVAKKVAAVVTSGSDSVSTANAVTDLLVTAPQEGITLTVGAEGDTLNGTSGNDTLTATGGNDGYEFNPGSGNDVITGFGLSVISYSDMYWGVNVDMTAGTTIGHHKSDNFTRIQEVIGTDYDDRIVGGNPDNDEWESFIGMAGDDYLDGGTGWDGLFYNNEEGENGVTVNLQTGQATDTYGDTDTFVSMEIIQATEYADTLIGSDADDVFVQFRALGGDDILQGGQGYEVAHYGRDYKYQNADGVRGESGINADLAAGTIIDGFGDTDTVSNIDEVRATQYDDVLVGSDASYKEEFRGEAGNDIMTGAGGVDYFSFGSGDGEDIITDFTVGTDKLEFRSISSFSDLVITSDGNGTVLSYGDGGKITLNGVQGLSEGDCIFF